MSNGSNAFSRVQAERDERQLVQLVDAYRRTNGAGALSDLLRRSLAMNTQQVQPTIPFLSSLSDRDTDAKITNIINRLMVDWESSWNKLSEILEDPARMVRGIIMDLKENSFTRNDAGDQTTFEPSKCWQSVVNGDVQRGKTLVQMLHVVVTYLINQDTTIADKPFTILGTVQPKWVHAMDSKFKQAHVHNGNVLPDGNSSTSNEEDAQSESEDEVALDAENEQMEDEELGNAVVREMQLFNFASIPIVNACGLRVEKTVQKVTNAIVAGGVIIFARTKSNLVWLKKEMHKVISTEHLINSSKRTYRLILDEADRMLGKGSSILSSNSSYQYEDEIAIILMGRKRDDNCRFLSPHSIVYVSATNMLPVLAMFLGLANPKYRFIRDIVGFKSSPSYAGFLNFFTPFRDSHTNQPLFLNNERGSGKDAEFSRFHEIDSGVMKMYREVNAKDKACIMDCLSKKVSHHLANSMCDHISKIITSLSRSGLQLRIIFIVLNGSQRQFKGQVGIRFPNIGLFKRNVRRMTGIKLGADVVDANGYIHLESLTQVLRWYDNEARSVRPNYTRFFENDTVRVSMKCLQLTLSFLRVLDPDSPVALVGYGGVINRCLSLVAVSEADVDTPPILCVTHAVMCPSLSANSDDLAQQFQRPATTFHAFYTGNGFNNISILAPSSAWRIVKAYVGFNNAWFTGTQDDVVANVAQICGHIDALPTQASLELLRGTNELSEFGRAVAEVIAEYLPSLPDRVLPLFFKGKGMRSDVVSGLKILSELIYEKCIFRGTVNPTVLPQQPTVPPEQHIVAVPREVSTVRLTIEAQVKRFHKLLRLIESVGSPPVLAICFDSDEQYTELFGRFKVLRQLQVKPAGVVIQKIESISRSHALTHFKENKLSRKMKLKLRKKSSLTITVSHITKNIADVSNLRDPAECMICQENDFQQRDDQYMEWACDVCRHRMHFSCLRQWFVSKNWIGNRERHTCPMRCELVYNFPSS